MDELSKQVLLTHINEQATDIAKLRATVEHLRVERDEVRDHCNALQGKLKFEAACTRHDRMMIAKLADERDEVRQRLGIERKFQWPSAVAALITALESNVAKLAAERNEAQARAEEMGDIAGSALAILQAEAPDRGGTTGVKGATYDPHEAACMGYEVEERGHD